MLGTKTVRALVILGVSLLMTGYAGSATAQTKPAVSRLGIENPASAIYIGHSFFYYNNSLHMHVARLVAAASPTGRNTLRSTSVTISGASLDQHDVNSYFRPNAIGAFSVDANNNVVFNKFDRLFDVAILMDCSPCPVHEKLKSNFREFSKKHSNTVRSHGAIPVFFMTWAFADRPEMTAEVAEAYTAVGNENRALVIPTGLAFARSIAKRTDLNLYDPDKRHPSLAGSYLSACMVYASLFNKSPEGLKYTAGLPEADAKFLQTIAWETVQAYHQK